MSIIEPFKIQKIMIHNIKINIKNLFIINNKKIFSYMKAANFM
jgi:hypothetical protein